LLKEAPSNLNLPNTLTVVRIFLVPVLLHLLVQERYGATLVVFAVAGFTDGLDGYIAKRWNLSTRLGAVLDPLADKLLVVSSVVLLALQARLPLWLAAVVVGRDVVILSGAVAYRVLIGKVDVAPTRLSKGNTVAQIGVVLAVLVHGAGMTGLSTWLPVFFGLAFVTTVASGAQYVVVWGHKASDFRGRRSVGARKGE
jgi:cardiolipin synthase